MGIREWSNNHPKAMGGAVGLCVLACAGVLIVQAMGNRHTIQTTAPDDYFSIDDGKTFFATSSTNVPPFTYEGQTAVRANVFDCNGTKFVGYLDRYTPDALKVMQPNQPAPAWVDVQGRELKKPGDKAWISAADIHQLQKIINVTTPSGLSGTPVTVEP